MAVYMWYKSLVSLASWWVVKPCKLMSKKWHGHNLHSKIASSFKKTNSPSKVSAPGENLNKEIHPPKRRPECNKQVVYRFVVKHYEPTSKVANILGKARYGRKLHHVAMKLGSFLGFKKRSLPFKNCFHVRVLNSISTFCCQCTSC